jgi:hypothetical protein
MKNHNLRIYVLFYNHNFLVETFLQLLQRIRNQHQILRFLKPILNLLSRLFKVHILALFASFEAK